MTSGERIMAARTARSASMFWGMMRSFWVELLVMKSLSAMLGPFVLACR